VWTEYLRPKIKQKNPDFAHMLCKAGEGIHSEREGKDCAARHIYVPLPKFCRGR